MLIDLIDGDNYISVNISLIGILGLSGATYCSELFSILKKAIRKRKLVDECAINVDREYIASRTSIPIGEQLAIDARLAEMDLIDKYDESKPDSFTVNVPGFVGLISGVDSLSSSEFDRLRKKLAPKTKESKAEGRRLGLARNIKDSLSCKEGAVRDKLCEWVDLVVVDGKRPMTKGIAKEFEDTVIGYAKGDDDVALKIIQIAITNCYRDPNWAINSYERNLGVRNDNAPRTTRQARATAEDVAGGDKF